MFGFAIIYQTTLIASIWIQSSDSKLYFTDEYKEESLFPLIEGIQQIVYRYFIKNMYFLIFDRDHDSRSTDYISNYLHNINTPILTTKDISQEDLFSQGDVCWTRENLFYKKSWCGLKRIDNLENNVGFIILRTSIKNECFIDKEWKKSPFWNPRTLFLLILARPVTEGTIILAEVIQDCWDKLNILNVVVIYQGIVKDKWKSSNQNFSCDYKKSESILSYNPFLGQALVFSLFDRIRSGYNLFPNKLKDTRGFLMDSPIMSPNNLLLTEKVDHDGNTVFDGPNGKMFNEIVRAMNLTVNIIPYSSFENDKIMKELTSKMTGIQAYQDVVHPYNLRKTSYAFDGDCFTAIVPKALEIPKYLKVILPFTQTVWVLFVSTNICICVIWKIVTLIDTFENNIKIRRNIILDVYKTFVGGSIQNLPSFFPQRFIVTFLLIFNFILNNAYTGSLNSCLINVRYLPDLNMLMEALDSDLKFGVVLPMASFDEIMETADFSDPHVVKLNRKLIVFKSNDEILNMIANHRNVPKLTLKYAGRTIINKPIYFKNGHPMIHILEECYRSAWNGFVAVGNHSPFLGVMSFVVTCMHEGGLYAKWKTDFLNQPPTQGRSSNPIILTKEHLQSPFFLVLLGLCLACLIFLSEIVIYRFNHRFDRI